MSYSYIDENKSTPIVRHYLIALLALVSLLHGFIIRDAFSNSIVDKKSIETVVHELLSNIYEKNYVAILQMVSEHGVLDGDTRISKQEIAQDLRNEKSYLHQHLYKTVSNDDVKLCSEKLKGKLLVSPFAFYKFYGDNYEVKATVIDKKGKYFSIYLKGKASAKNVKCNFELWHFTLMQQDGSYMLNSYFFH